MSDLRGRFWAKRGPHCKPEMLLAEIRRLRRKGQCLALKRIPNRTYLAARRYFGSWEGAVQAAGFDFKVTTGVRRWSKHKVIERIQLHAAAGIPLTAPHVSQRYLFLHRAAIKAFPSN